MTGDSRINPGKARWTIDTLFSGQITGPAKLILEGLAAETFTNPYLGFEVARAFGAAGEKVRRPGDVEGALRRARAGAGAAVVDVAIDREVSAPVVHFESVEERRV